MCNVVKGTKRALGIDDGGTQIAAAEAASAEATLQANNALKAQQSALATAQASSVTASDSEAARKSSEARMRRLMSGGGWGAGFSGGAQQGSVGYRMLTGA